MNEDQMPVTKHLYVILYALDNVTYVTLFIQFEFFLKIDIKYKTTGLTIQNYILHFYASSGIAIILIIYVY